MSLERDERSGLVMALTFCGVAAVLAVSTAVALIRSQPGPQAHIGDIIAFNRPAIDPAPAPLAVTRADGTACVLDPALLANQGGSLVVEGAATAGTPAYRVHWAGPRTASGAQDCGSVADLTLDETALNALSASAGGYGVENKTLALSAPMPAMALAIN